MTFRETKEVSPPPPPDLLDWLEGKWDAAEKNGKEIPDEWRGIMQAWRTLHSTPPEVEFFGGPMKFVDVSVAAPIPTGKMIKGMESNWREMRERGEKVNGEWVKLMAVWKVLNRITEMELEYEAKSVFGDRVLVGF